MPSWRLCTDLRPGKGLDLVLHSPGGSPEAAEAVVNYLRSKFTDIRVIIPQAAMSAATMLSCAANSIVMGAHSFLGSIDPQMIMPAPTGGAMMAPAQAIIDQFSKAVEDCQDPKKLGAWIPILPQYGPALLKQCENALRLAEELATEWLKNWMFAGSRLRASEVRKYCEDLGRSYGVQEPRSSHSLGCSGKDGACNPGSGEGPTVSGPRALRIPRDHARLFGPLQLLRRLSRTIADGRS